MLNRAAAARERSRGHHEEVEWDAELLPQLVDWSHYFLHVGGDFAPPGPRCHGNTDKMLLPGRIAENMRLADM